MTRPAQLGLVIASLVIIAAIYIVDDARREFQQREADWEAAERSLCDGEPGEWPTPPPLPTARKTPEGYEYLAPAGDGDPCGSGPIRPASSEDGDAA